MNLSKRILSLERGGPFYACIHPKSLTELQASLRAEQNNIISQMVATEEMIKAKGQGYVGKLLE